MNAEKYIAQQRGKLNKMEEIHLNCKTSHVGIRNVLNAERSGDYSNVNVGNYVTDFQTARDFYEVGLKSRIVKEVSQVEKDKKTLDKLGKEHITLREDASNGIVSHSRDAVLYARLLEESLSTPYSDRANIETKKYAATLIDDVREALSDIDKPIDLHHVAHGGGKYDIVLARLGWHRKE